MEEGNVGEAPSMEELSKEAVCEWPCTRVELEMFKLVGPRVFMGGEKIEE